VRRGTSTLDVHVRRCNVHTSARRPGTRPDNATSNTPRRDGAVVTGDGTPAARSPLVVDTVYPLPRAAHPGAEHQVGLAESGGSDGRLARQPRSQAAAQHRFRSPAPHAGRQRRRHRGKPRSPAHAVDARARRTSTIRLEPRHRTSATVTGSSQRTGCRNR
jgi:hypothetical protein